MWQVQNTGHRLQVTGHKTFKKKVSGYVTIRHMFGIDHAFRFCSDSKTTKWQKLHVVLEIQEFLFSFVSLEISDLNKALSLLHVKRLGGTRL